MAEKNPDKPAEKQVPTDLKKEKPKKTKPSAAGKKSSRTKKTATQTKTVPKTAKSRTTRKTKSTTRTATATTIHPKSAKALWQKPKRHPPEPLEKLNPNEIQHHHPLIPALHSPQQVRNLTQ